MQPYDPQRPATPQSFAGRPDLLRFVDTALQEAVNLRRGTALLLYGHRGSGKTSALRKVQSMVRAAAPDAIVVEVPLRVPSSDAMLVQGIAELVSRQVAAQARLTSRMKRALESLSAITVLGTGVNRTPPQALTASTLLTVWQEALNSLGELPILSVSIDDAELLKAPQIGILKTMVESVSPVPLLVSVAGGPDLMEKLTQRDASPILRAFSGAVFDIGQFDLEETREALEAPLTGMRASGRWEAEGVQALYHLTHGYPYLVQCFAAAAYKDHQRIGAGEVRAAIPEALRLASSWLDRELTTASNEDIRAFAKIAGLDKIELRSSDFLRLGVNSVYIPRLVSLGVLKHLSRGCYELRKAPAIAYFQALRRGLSIE
ncbi:MAG TPA: AAA family ATPase [Thermoplasmata archaeon]|nr:AAA family ATPase [Thermoplasmata archaeon]